MVAVTLTLDDTQFDTPARCLQADSSWEWFVYRMKISLTETVTLDVSADLTETVNKEPCEHAQCFYDMAGIFLNLICLQALSYCFYLALSAAGTQKIS